VLNFTAPGNYYVGIDANASSFTIPLCYQLDIETSNSSFKEQEEMDMELNDPGFSISPNPAIDKAILIWKEMREGPFVLEVMKRYGSIGFKERNNV
jgi:hypothetical protein